MQGSKTNANKIKRIFEKVGFQRNIAIVDRNILFSVMCKSENVREHQKKHKKLKYTGHLKMN